MNEFDLAILALRIGGPRLLFVFNTDLGRCKVVFVKITKHEPHEFLWFMFSYFNKYYSLLEFVELSSSTLYL